MQIACPSCGTNVTIPPGFTGVQKQCRSCRNFVQVPRNTQEPAEQETPESAGDDRQAQAAPPPRRRRVNYRRPVDRADDGPFEFESKGMNCGLMGGIVMMILAAVWFFGGLAAGIIFFYPPILFFIGLIAAISGLASGNITGSQRRAPRARRRR